MPWRASVLVMMHSVSGQSLIKAGVTSRTSRESVLGFSVKLAFRLIRTPVPRGRHTDSVSARKKCAGAWQFLNGRMSGLR